MAGNKSALLLALVVIAGISGICSAVTHTVGGNVGWTIPTSNSVYSTWAARQTFAVGDVLVFNFAAGHTVAEVSRANYNGCNAASPIGTVHTSGPVNITLNAPGTHYYICTVSGHCSAGQRLAVTVTGPSASPTGSPASSPAPAGGAATPTEGPSGGAASPTEGPGGSGGTTSPTGTPTADSPSGSSNFATSTGVSLLSLGSVAVAALMF